MIDFIHLKHFKCFSKLDLPLGNLTLLTGHNATGKSSIIQSLLLLHQGISSLATGRSFPLNGETVSLGSFADVLDGRSGRKTFTLGASSAGERLDFTFESEDKTALVAPLISILATQLGALPHEILCNGQNANVAETLSSAEGANLMPLIRNLLHVSTERIGPRETYAADPSGDEQLGPKGEYTAWFLHRNGEREVPENLRRTDTPPLLIRQTEAWLAHFFPGAAFEVERIKDTNLLTLRFRTSAKDDFHRPSNVGYGLSHLLPVLVGGLGVRRGGILVVENPEAHLHPSAQAEIGAFLAAVASVGAQVIIETHSDHVLNGVRLAIKRGFISADKTQIHYFNPRDSAAQVISPVIRKDGSLDSWPAGFFDQIDKDLDQLTEW
jgi:predicted ATPase